jgi:hypothetical protein
LKFFFQKNSSFKKVSWFKKISFNKSTLPTLVVKNNFYYFSKFILTNGSLTKTRLLLSFVLLNFNNFIYTKNNFIFENYTSIKWIVDDILEKKHNSLYVFDLVMNLIKPPFVIKSVIVPKKLRKKTKKKYLIKIVYKNENKRLKNAYKQLYYYSNRFTDSKVNIRLYKAFMFSFLE